jgi:hypothetical protein
VIFLHGKNGRKRKEATEAVADYFDYPYGRVDAGIQCFSKIELAKIPLSSMDGQWFTHDNVRVVYEAACNKLLDFTAFIHTPTRSKLRTSNRSECLGVSFRLWCDWCIE